MPEQRVKPDIKFAKQVLQDVEAKKLDKKLVKHFPYTRDGVSFLDAVKGIADQGKEAMAVLTGQPGKTLKVNLAFKKTDLEDTSTFDQEVLCTQYTQGKGFGTIVTPILTPIPEAPRQDEDQVKSHRPKSFVWNVLQRTQFQVPCSSPKQIQHFDKLYCKSLPLSASLISLR